MENIREKINSLLRASVQFSHSPKLRCIVYEETITSLAIDVTISSIRKWGYTLLFHCCFCCHGCSFRNNTSTTITFSFSHPSIGHRLITLQPNMRTKTFQQDLVTNCEQFQTNIFNSYILKKCLDAGKSPYFTPYCKSFHRMFNITAHSTQQHRRYYQKAFYEEQIAEGTR